MNSDVDDEIDDEKTQTLRISTSLLRCILYFLFNE